ncbi:MAG: M42 family metallopeptidase [Calditrichaeota bacterium]|nr:M42 family metallopeptidase [Calditrichota bacterium]MCB9391054.1 M42 family metallopeptidase [Calditrichota bacterium]
MDFKLLKKLCESHAVSGREEGIRKMIRDEFQKLGLDVSVDAMGNMTGFKKGTGKKKVMLAGHMDEIGFIVSHIDKEGFLRFQPCGGFDPRTLMSQRVYVHTAKKRLLGVMGTKPVHVLKEEEKKKSLEVTDYFVDLGLPATEVEKLVEIGDPITMARELDDLGDCLTGKSLDNRFGVWLMIEALKLVKKHSVNIYAVATTQEEVGLRGALAVSRDINPDVGLALDVTIAADIPGTPPQDHVTKVGGGACIKILDGSMISNPKIVRELKDVATKKKIPWQYEILPRGGTDGGAMRMVSGGCAVGAISVALRYVHSTVETAHKSDLEACVKLLAAYLESTSGSGYELDDRL